MVACVQAKPQATDKSADPNPAVQLDQKLAQLKQSAQQAQLKNDFQFAAEQWQQVWKQFPNSDDVGQARLQAGNCHLQLQQFPLAIENLKAAIPKLTDQAVQLPKARLLLGYSQLELGKRLAGKEDATSKKQATDLFATATRSLEQLLNSSPSDPDAEQACFFLGNAYEQLDRKQDAINAYKKMDDVQNKNGMFRLDSLYAIGDLYHSLGQYGDANKYFDLFLAETKQVGHPDRDLVNFSASQTLVALGEAAKTNNDATGAKTYFEDAIARLKEITDQEANGSPAPIAALVRDSKKQMALCHRQLDQFQQAADLFASLSEQSDATASTTMQTFAGLSYLDAKQTAKAFAYFKRATTTAGKPGVEAARWLADQHLKQAAYQDSFDVATKFLPYAQPPHLVPLKLLQAEAAIEIPAKQAEAVKLFQAIASEHADHPLAPFALYNLAFGQVQQKQYEAAVVTTKTFLSKHAGHSYATNVWEVQADALMLSKNYTEAEKTYSRLMLEPSLQQNPKRPSWGLSSANAKFQQRNFAGAILVAQSVLEQLKNPSQRADALHLIGTSHYQLAQYPQAAESLSAAVNADPNSPLNDDSQFFLALSQLKLGDFENANQSIAALAAKSPSSPRLNQAYIQLGNQQYDAGKQPEAILFFQKVIDAASAMPTERAAALFGAAWANLKNNQAKTAEELFSQVINQYPDSKLVATAKEGRADARRLTGNGESSIADLKNLAVKAQGKNKVDLLMDIGLSQVDEKDWPAAIATFESLVKSASDDERLDQFYYELAWANRSIDNEQQAMEYFAKIADQMPNGSFAAEANFHLGKKAYYEQRWSDAVTAFRACASREDAKPDVREKAAYKLAWAFYKQNKFSQSHSAFKAQVDKFPSGPLLADGKFMLAESLFRDKKFGDAFAAYMAAKPIIETSDVVSKHLKWLTILHGTQAANKQKDYPAAIDLAQGIQESNADLSVKQDVFLELGTAHNGLKNAQQATQYWTLAAENLGKTGAQAMCMLGNQLLANKKYEDAITQYKRVFFGFGGRQATASVRPWQAYARYEAARCNYVQVASAKDVGNKRQLVQQAIEHFEKLVQDYPDDKLAPEAKRQIELIKKIKL